MLSKKLEDALNVQMNAELWAAHLYLTMSAYFAGEGKPGFANLFRIHFLEEQDHAMILFNYITNQNGKLKIQAIPEIPCRWDSPLAVFEETLKTEELVTGKINDLVTLAREEKDYATENMLQWFVEEQLEEEIDARSYIDALKLIDGNGFGIYTLDKELQQKTYTPCCCSKK